MVYLQCDYTTGAHPKILEKLVETNMVPQRGYLDDEYCERARGYISETFDVPPGAIYPMVGGTQANLTVISAMLRDSEGVIAADSAHITVHEAGSIEINGHKVLVLPTGPAGKINAAQLKEYLDRFMEDPSNNQMVWPGLVYITFPTELGTLYSKQELTAIHDVCKQFRIPLFIDGARLAYAFASPENDVEIKDLAKLCEVFYIGTTKIGALCGEAVVFCGMEAPRNFINSMRKRGALMAKGRLLGIQLQTLFEDGLYFEIAKNAIKKAEKMKRIFDECGIEYFVKSPTNQQFIIVTDEQAEKLAENVVYNWWERVDDSHVILRLVTSWCTTDEELVELETALKNL